MDDVIPKAPPVGDRPLAVPSSSSRPVVLLLAVRDVSEEQRCLAQLDAIEAAVGAIMLPALDRNGLVDRVAKAIEQAGATVQIRPFCDAAHESDWVASEPAPSRGRPERVFSAGGVDPACLQLAATLCRTQPVPIELADDEMVASALVLVDPRTARIHEVLPAFTRSAGRGGSWGILYALDPVETRFALLKTLALAELPTLSDPRLLSMASPGDRALGAPPNLADPTSPDGTRLFRAPGDLLVLSGHANPFDATLGRDKALCARAASEGRNTNGQTLPCFSNGECFRQPLMGRSPDEVVGLTSLNDTQVQVLVLAGCHTAAVGGAWFDTGATLAYACQQSTALASLVTTGIGIERLELNLLMMALLSEGRPLGDVARTVNRVRRDVHGHANVLPDGLGPFLVLGSPTLRFRPGNFMKRPAFAMSSSRLVIDLDGVSVNRCAGTFIRVDLPTDDSLFLCMLVPPEGVWWRGVLNREAAANTLYLWLGVAPEGPDRLVDVSCVIEIGSNPTAPTVALLESHLRQLSFWTTVLDAFREDAANEPLFAASLEAANASLAPAARTLSVAANLVRARPGFLLDDRRMRQLADSAVEQAAALDAQLLFCLVELCARFGTMHSGSWERSFVRVAVDGPLDSCGCGMAPLWGQRSCALGNATLQRSEYQCARCGPAGEDDGRRLLRLDTMPLVVDSGDQLEVRCRLHAPEDERVVAWAAVVVEGLYSGLYAFGPATRIDLVPSEERSVALGVLVPTTFSAGVYPLAVIAIVNGSHTIARQMIQVRSAAVRG